MYSTGEEWNSTLLGVIIRNHFVFELDPFQHNSGLNSRGRVSVILLKVDSIILKTLFNIVEVPFKRLLNFDVYVV